MKTSKSEEDKKRKRQKVKKTKSERKTKSVEDKKGKNAKSGEGEKWRRRKVKNYNFLVFLKLIQILHNTNTIYITCQNKIEEMHR